MTTTLEYTPIETVAKIDPKKIDPMANYVCRLQIGARNRWRRFRGGTVTTKKNESDQTLSVTHQPAVHLTKPIKGETLLGLVEIHNRWLDDNKTRSTVSGTDSTVRRGGASRPVQDARGPLYRGDVARQLLVTHFEETDEPSEDYKAFRNPVDMLRHAVGDAAKDIIAAFRDETTKGKKTA